MLRWLTTSLKRGRPQLTDGERAERAAIRREAEQERLRADARMAEQRAWVDSHGGADGFGGGW